MNHQLHWSHISMFTRCAEQFRRRYIEGEVLPPGCGAVTGTGLHKAAELDLTRKMETGELAPEEEVKEAARDGVVREFDKPIGVHLTEEEREEGPEKVKARAIDSAVACAGVHHTAIAPHVRPVRVERKWVLDVPKLGMSLAGTIDCDEGDVIWDWKTSAKSPAADEAANSGQITMYSLAKKTLDGVLPRARLAYVVKNRTPKAVVQETERTLEDFAPLLRAMERMRDAIKKGVFPFAAWMAPRPWWCNPKWCGYYRSCGGVCTKAMVLT